MSGGVADAAPSTSRGAPSSSARTTPRRSSCSATTSRPTATRRCRRRRPPTRCASATTSSPTCCCSTCASPTRSGLDVLREIRASDGATGRYDPSLPVIVLSGRGTDADRVRGFAEGADDYVVKPFHYPELEARIRAVLRRRAARREGPLRVGEIVVDTARREVRVGGPPVQLANKEFGLLRALASEPTAGVQQGGAAARRLGLSLDGPHPDARLPRQSPAAQARSRGGPLRRQLLGCRLPADRRAGGGAMESLAEAATATAWPLALTFACAAARRPATRARAGAGALNRALHELRRPLQALLLAAPRPPGRDRRRRSPRSGAGGARRSRRRDQRRAGGRRPGGRSTLAGCSPTRPSRWRAPARDARSRARASAARRRARSSTPIAGAIARALDNLIANALEHGASRILIAAPDRGATGCGSPSRTAIGGDKPTAASRSPGPTGRRRSATRARPRRGRRGSPPSTAGASPCAAATSGSPRGARAAAGGERSASAEPDEPPRPGGRLRRRRARCARSWPPGSPAATATTSRRSSGRCARWSSPASPCRPKRVLRAGRHRALARGAPGPGAVRAAGRADVAGRGGRRAPAAPIPAGSYVPAVRARGSRARATAAGRRASAPAATRSRSRSPAPARSPPAPGAAREVDVVVTTEPGPGGGAGQDLRRRRERAPARPSSRRGRPAAARALPGHQRREPRPPPWPHPRAGAAT